MSYKMRCRHLTWTVSERSFYNPEENQKRLKRKSFADLPAYSIAASYAVSTAAYALNFRQLLLRQIQYRHSSKAAALLGAILASVLWTITLSMAVQLRQEGWKPALKFWWLPLGPLALVGLVEYTFRMFTSSRADIRKLRTKMYSCKTA